MGDSVITSQLRKIPTAAGWREKLGLGVADINAQTGTTYTLLEADLGRVITFSNAAAIAVTIPTGLDSGFWCECFQIGAGQVTFTAGATVNSYGGLLSLAGRYAGCTIISVAADSFVISGTMA